MTTGVGAFAWLKALKKIKIKIWDSTHVHQLFRGDCENVWFLISHKWMCMRELTRLREHTIKGSIKRLSKTVFCHRLHLLSSDICLTLYNLCKFLSWIFGPLWKEYIFYLSLEKTCNELQLEKLTLSYSFNCSNSNITKFSVWTVQNMDFAVFKRGLLNHHEMTLLCRVVVLVLVLFCFSIT